jgi:hypothetical protein
MIARWLVNASTSTQAQTQMSHVLPCMFVMAALQAILCEDMQAM